MEPKRLYRSTTDRKIGGVAAGLGEYFGMDPLLIRLVFLILLFAGGGGFLIYLVLWIVTPEKPFSLVDSTNGTGGTVNSGYSEARTQPGSGESPESGADSPKQEHTGSTPGNDPQTKKRKNGSLIGGLVLITIGSLFLADELFPWINFGDLWPLILVAIGAGLLINAVSGKKKESQNY